MKEFGKCLQDKRREKKLTLKQVADDLGVSISYLSDLENGEKLPPNSKKDEYSNFMNKIFEYYNINQEERRLILELADKELLEKGHLSNDITNYLGKTPMASVALRTAKEKELTDEEWKKIIENMNK